MSQPCTVAVIIPAYNCADYIDEALESLEKQTSAPDEVIVVDDGSTDQTSERVSSFRAKSRLRIILVRQANQGIAAARNAGVKRCSADFIALLDGDDAFYPRFIEKTKQALLAHPELVLCFSDRDVVDEKCNFIRRDLDEPKFRALKAEHLSDGVSILREDPFIALVPGNVIPIGNLMLRKATFEKIGGFDPDLQAVEDKPFLLCLTKEGAFGFIDEPQGTWRRHSSNTSGSGNNFKMNWYSELGYKKLQARADSLGLNEAERAALGNERNLMPSRLLYSASVSANPVYPKLAFEMFRDGRVGIFQLLQHTARFIRSSFKRVVAKYQTKK